MPTYEYACRSCGQHLEVVQSFKDDALTTCPHCQGQLRKVFGNIGIAFKGSGFYKTDSRSSSSKSSSSKATASSEGSTSESSGESKPDSSKPDSTGSSSSSSTDSKPSSGTSAAAS